MPVGVGAQIEEVTAPTGSRAEDSSYPIPSRLLNYLSSSGKSSLLSVSNIGASTLAKVQTSLEVIDNLTDFETYLLDGTALDGLANGSSSTAFTYPNVGTSRFVRVVVILGEITPTGTPSVEIVSGLTAYTLNISTTTSQKRLEFNNIAESFVNGFQVRNFTGVPFASSGNSVVVVAL
jgi:hypothetical protein